VEAALRRALEHHTLREAKRRYEIYLEGMIEQRTAQVNHLSYHDALTGLPNRVLLTERLAQAIERTHGGHGDRQFAVLFVDLDRFKVVNDSLGHPSGDWLLIALSGRLKQCVRTTDTVARLGGDEFAILLNGLEEGYDPATIAGRIYEQLSRPFELGGHEVFTSASIGIAYSTTGYERPEDILRDADTAMYRAKSNGKARHEVFDVAMHAHAFEQLKLETDLRHALDRGEIEVYYQPIYVLSGGRAEGFEALVRWRHPERGLIPPLEFIPLAEETGLIVPIGMHVLDTACRQVREWNQALPADAPLSISVNISGRQFKEKDFVGHVERMLKATGLPPSCLRLEITETVVMDNTEEVARILERLKACGVRISLDDFGTGYSSLSYLHRFPINTLKIDRSFVQSMGADAESAKIIKTILTLAAELNMDVVAEGIETGQQRDQLRALGCDFGQGYLFSRPVESGEAWNLVARAASTARGRAAGAISRGQTDAAVEPSHELAAV
ncbi:MAG: putative bifunctional diguanylate cyclase/phosphodiesterase, partial [Pyrinomonadaceae bacterium]